MGPSREGTAVAGHDPPERRTLYSSRTAEKTASYRSRGQWLAGVFPDSAEASSAALLLSQPQPATCIGRRESCAPHTSVFADPADSSLIEMTGAPTMHRFEGNGCTQTLRDLTRLLQAPLCEEPLLLLLLKP